MRRLAWRAASAARRHRRRAPVWASGGNGARYVALGRRMRRMTSGTSTSECSGCLFCPAPRSGRIPGTAQPRRRTRRGSFSGRHGRQAACLTRACAAAASGRRPSIRRVRACSSTGAMWPVSGSRQEARRCGKRKGKRAEESVPADRADAGQPGRGFSAAGSVRTRMRLAGRLAGVDGSDRHAGAARGRNRGSGSKALGMISPVWTGRRERSGRQWLDAEMHVAHDGVGAQATGLGHQFAAQFGGN